MSITFVTFLLAIIGYTLLTANTINATRGKVHRPLMSVTAGIILIHVFMVWAFRYEWQFSQATRNGYVGFLLFHGALALIVLSVMQRDSRSRLFIMASFLIVSAGANGAVYRYEVVEIYRIPVAALTLVGLVVLGKHAYSLHLANRARRESGASA